MTVEIQLQEPADSWEHQRLWGGKHHHMLRLTWGLFLLLHTSKKKKRQKENTSSRCLFSDNRIWNVVRENEERRKISSLQHMITVQWNKKKSVPRLLLCVRAKDSDTAVQRKRESTETCRCASVSLASDGNVGLKDLDSHENRGWTEFKQLEALESGVLGMTVREEDPGGGEVEEGDGGGGS